MTFMLPRVILKNWIKATTTCLIFIFTHHRIFSAVNCSWWLIIVDLFSGVVFVHGAVTSGLHQDTISGLFVTRRRRSSLAGSSRCRFVAEFLLKISCAQFVDKSGKKTKSWKHVATPDFCILFKTSVVQSCCYSSYVATGHLKVATSSF